MHRVSAVHKSIRKHVDLRRDAARLPRGQVDVDVTFEVDTDGILHIGARDLDSGRIVRKRVKLGGEDAEEGKPQ